MNENQVEVKLKKTILFQRIAIIALILIFAVVYIISFNLFETNAEKQEITKKNDTPTKKISIHEEIDEVQKPVESDNVGNEVTEEDDDEDEEDNENEIPLEEEKSVHDEIIEFYEKNKSMTEDYTSFEEEYFDYLSNINMSEEDLLSLFDDDQLEKIETEIEIHLEEIKDSLVTRTYENHLKAVLIYSFILRTQYSVNSALKSMSVAEGFIGEINDYQLIRAYYIEMGKNFTALYDFQDAVEQYSKLIELNINSYLGYYLRGCIYFYSSNYDMALNDFQHQLKIEDIQEEINLEHYEQACMYTADMYKSKYNTLKAIEFARKSLEYNDDSIDNYIYLAKLYMSINNYDSASVYISDAELIDEENSEVILANCQLLREYEKEYEQALVLVNELLYKTPEDYVAYNERGKLYTNLRLYNAAFNDFNRAIEIEPMYANAYGNRGWIYYKYRNQRDKALADYNNAVLLDTNLEYVYNNRGVLLMESFRDNAKAIEDYNHALKINDRYYIALVNRGIAKRRMNEFKGAIDDFTKAKGLENENYIAFYQLGKTYFETGEFAKALESYTEALDRNDETWELYFERAKCNVKLRKFKESIKDLSDALKLNPSLSENEDYQNLLNECQQNKS